MMICLTKRDETKIWINARSISAFWHNTAYGTDVMLVSGHTFLVLEKPEMIAEMLHELGV